MSGEVAGGGKKRAPRSAGERVECAAGREAEPRRHEIEIRPITVKAARALVKQWHRKLPDVQGGLFASSAFVRGSCVGVGIAGNPARVWQGTARFVISRVAAPAVKDNPDAKNACSALYGSLCRAAKALGYREAWTYTVDGESGVSLKAAGFTCLGRTKDGEHSRPSRPRKKAVLPQPKYRWWRRL